MAAQLLVEPSPSGLLTLTLSNPTRRNALDDGLVSQLEVALAAHPAAKVLLIQGEGTAFSAGYDLGALAALGPDAPLPDVRLGEVFDLLERHPAPSVALVRGPAYGAGFELACACDFRVADASAVFCAPPAKLGIVYAPKGLMRVAKVVGWQATRVLFLTARQVDAAQALALGLVEGVGGEAEAQALCATLLTMAPLAVAGMRSALNALTRGELDAAATARLEALRREAFLSSDAAEGRAAMLEKRPPRFQGR